MATSSSTSDKPLPHHWRSEAKAVFLKDVRSELRTRAALTTILLFAVSTLIMVSMVFKTVGLGLDQELVPDFRDLIRADRDAVVIRTVAGTSVTRASLLASLLWIVFFFSAMVGLPRTFLKEEEMRTAPALRLAARPTAVLAGKLLFNVALAAAVTLVVLPLFLILFTPRVAQWDLFLGYAVIGPLAMAGSATILGAIVARAGGKSYLMLPLAFPIVLPVLVICINGTADALRGNGGNQLLGLVSYVVAMVTVSGLLFEQVWTDH